MLKAHITNIALGIIVLFSLTHLVPNGHYVSLPYFLIAISVGALILLAVIWLVLHGGNIYAVTGSPAGATWITQDHCHHVHRVNCTPHCELVVGNWTGGPRKPGRECILPNPC